MILKICLIVIASLLILYYILCLVIYNKIFGKSNLTEKDINKWINSIKNETFKETVLSNMNKLKKIKKEEVFINSYDNKKLTGYLCMNNEYININNDTIVIFCHGFHSQYEFDFSLSGVDFYKQGYNMLFIDQRAHQKSKGKNVTFGIKERYDVLNWIKYINDRFSNTKKIILCGLSMGASTVMYTLPLIKDNNVVGAICDCGYDNPYKELEYMAKEKVGFLSNLLLPMINLLFIIRNGESLKTINTKDTLKDNKIPILIIHGENDKMVPVENAKRNYDNASSLKDILIVKNATHATSYLFDSKSYFNKVNEFLNLIRK